MKCLVCKRHKAFEFGILCCHCHAKLRVTFGNIVKTKVLQELSNVSPARFLSGTGKGALNNG